MTPAHGCGVGKMALSMQAGGKTSQTGPGLPLLLEIMRPLVVQAIQIGGERAETYRPHTSADSWCEAHLLEDTSAIRVRAT